MKADDRIYVAGHSGLVGSAIVRKLRSAGCRALVLRSHSELDLCRQDAVDAFFAQEKPAYVFLAAARVGGITANQSRPAEFIRDNLLIQTHVIDAAYRAGVTKLLFLASACAYPKLAPLPIREEAILGGPLEPSNRPYAVAKIAGIEMVDAYRRQYGLRGISVMPSNVYGPNDDFDTRNSHVVPALLRRFHEARGNGAEVATVKGTGSPRREFLHVDDLAEACIFVMREYDGPDPLNVGVGEDISIHDLAELVKQVVGFQGSLQFDATQPDGTPRKLLDVSRIQALGWRARMPLRQGLEETYAWYLQSLRQAPPQ